MYIQGSVVGLSVWFVAFISQVESDIKKIHDFGVMRILEYDFKSMALE